MIRESWWGRQLQREDLITTLEQGRRVEVELFQEKHRGLRTMGELLKSRMFGATEYAIQLRKRMTDYLSGGAGVAGDAQAPAFPDPHPEHGVLCDCDDCTEAVKRLLRACGVLPRKGVRR